EHGSAATGASGPAGHDHGGAGTAGSGGDDHSSGGPASPGGGDHHHDPASAGVPPPADAPQGTWTELRYGPFVIPPAGAGGEADHADIAVPTLAKPCTNCFLLQFQPDLIFADGSEANLDSGMMMHHAVLF